MVGLEDARGTIRVGDLKVALGIIESSGGVY